MKDEVDKKWLAISYGCILLGIYFSFIAYCSIFPLIEKNIDGDLPSNYVTGNFTSGINSMSSFIGITPLVIAIISIVFVLILLSLGTRAMSAAI